MSPGRHPTAPRAGTLTSTAALVLAGNIIARGLGFMFPVVLTRAVDRQSFAVVYFFVNTGFFVCELVLTGFPTAMTRQLAADPSGPRRGRWVRSAVLAGIPLLGVSVVAGGVLARAADASVLLMGVVVLGLSIDAYYFAALRGLQQFRLLVTYRLVANLVQLALLLVAASVGRVGVTLAVIVYSFVYLVPIVAIELSKGSVRALLATGARAEWESIRVLTRFAVPSLVSGVAYAAIFGLDVFFVRLLAPDDLADYGAARALTVPFTLVPFALGVVLMPRVAAASGAEKWPLLRQALTITVGVAVFSLGVYMLAGPLATRLAYPASYDAAADLIRPLAPAFALLGIYSVLSQWWLGSGRPLLPAVSLVIGALVAIAGHLTLTDRYGGEGAALAMAAGSGVALLLLGAATARAAVLERRPVAHDEPDSRRGWRAGPGREGYGG